MFELKDPLFQNRTFAQEFLVLEDRKKFKLETQLKNILDDLIHRLARHPERYQKKLLERTKKGKRRIKIWENSKPLFRKEIKSSNQEITQTLAKIIKKEEYEQRIREILDFEQAKLAFNTRLNTIATRRVLKVYLTW